MIVASLLLAIGAVALLVVGLAGGSGPYLIGSIAASLLAAISLVAGGRQFGAQPADAASGRVGAAPADHPAESSTDQPGGERGRVGGDPSDDRVAGVQPDVGDHVGPVPVNEEFSQVRTEEIAPARVGGGDGAVQRQPASVGAPSPTHTRSGQLLISAADDSGERRDVGGPNGVSPAADRAGLDGLGGLAGVGDVDDPGDLGDSDDEEPPDEPVAQPLAGSEAERLAGLDDAVVVIDGRPRYHLPGCVHLLMRESERLPVREAVELGFTPCGLCEPATALLADDHRA
ncbi:hypothetical protein HC031_08730 [Planosporangium thailandense]|uniref:Uncharacterized protein n=1 Tax=Planosporangium thailandense TaxID=765197 RepID=A0ABX0XX20_9ACTN|nr:hypothetical protein [Planosporangium thailandense]NJC69804.1 hypothetical protein [Planosporangium thailandense]